MQVPGAAAGEVPASIASWRSRAHAAALAPGTAEQVLASLPQPIAVVGNATPSRPWGAVIDGYATVLRLNNFRTEGFEALVGRRTDVWVTSGWEDVERREAPRMLSPFVATAPESAHTAAFTARHRLAIRHASTDVTHWPGRLPKPSTGLALARLLDLLGVPAELFGFDGFRTGHYWDPLTTLTTTHAAAEIDELRTLETMTLHESTTPGPDAAGRAPSGAFQLPSGYVARPQPEYYADIDRGVTWQPDVYRLVRDLGREVGVSRVIDIGCGQGRKVATLAPEFDVVGLDFGPNLAHCRAEYPWGRWIEANLERDAPPPVSASELRASAIVASDVIEHLVDPSALLTRLRRMLEHAPFAILTTPERVLTHGPLHLGPPPNRAHVREWTLDELRALAVAAGLDVAYAGLTASDSETWARKTSVLVLVSAVTAVTHGPELAVRAAALLALYDRERGPAPPPTPLHPDPAERLGRASDPAPASVDVISIVMRTKDRPRLLERAVRSVVAQTWPAWQLVVVNDAGDRAAVEAVIAAAAPHDPRVVVLHRTASVGMEAATNAGIAAATGRYLTILDDDDSWAPTFLASCATHLAGPRGARVAGVVTHAVKVVERLTGDGVTEVSREPFMPGLQAVSLALLTQRNQFPVNAFVYERAAIETVGRYREDLPVLGDWDFNLRFLRHFDVDVLALPLAHYHVRPDLAAGTFANSPPALHLAFETRVRNEWLRADLDAGRFGLGVLASLRTLLVDHDEVLRHTDALAREQHALVAHEAERQRQAEADAARVKAQTRAVYALVAQALGRRLAARGARRVAVVGTGDLAELLADVAPTYGFVIAAVGDNDTRRHGQSWGALQVQPVADAVLGDVDAVALASVAHAGVLRTQVRDVLRAGGVTRLVLAPRF